MNSARTDRMHPDRAHELAARAFDDAMHALGLSNCEVARWWGCRETVVRDVRAGRKPLTGERLLLSPPTLRAETCRRLDAAGDPTPAAGSREDQAMAAAGCAARLAAKIIEKMPGGIDDAELDEIAEEAARTARSLRPLNRDSQPPAQRVAPS